MGIGDIVADSIKMLILASIGGIWWQPICAQRDIIWLKPARPSWIQEAKGRNIASFTKCLSPWFIISHHRNCPHHRRIQFQKAFWNNIYGSSDERRASRNDERRNHHSASSRKHHSASGYRRLCGNINIIARARVIDERDFDHRYEKISGFAFVAGSFVVKAFTFSLRFAVDNI